ncbi:hypothetical protein CN918_26135 [Priestia megaterium]|nr:hypothetical protein CN918_26135 [Priestia megaterium]
MNYLQDVIQEMSKFIDGFEVREQQLTMMEHTYTAMKERKKAAIEAPTGTGKSFGYLLPYVAVKLEKPDFRITINTHTIALQSQLQQDIQMANKVYLSLLKTLKRPSIPLNVVTLKGNGNYFCEYRFEEAKEDNLSFSVVDDIETFLRKELPRDKQHMDMEFSATSWDRVRVDGCLKRKCPFKDKCTYFQHYSKIDTFDIVIANHALFFFRYFYSDKFWEGFQFHVFDEGHKLERGILDASTYSLGFRNIESWIYQGGKMAERLNASSQEVEAWREKYMSHPIYEESRALFERLTQYFKPPNTAATVDVMRIPPLEIKTWVRKLYDWQKDLYNDMMDNVLGFITDKKENEEFQRARTSWVGNLMILREYGSLSNHPQNIGVIWAELDKRRAVLKATPSSIDHIPSPFQTGLLFTSGTISQDESCIPFARRMNVKLDIDIVLSTPFPLKDQTLVYLSRDLNPKTQLWSEQLKKEIMTLLQAGKQKTFVLFTSTTLMKNTYDALMADIYNLDDERPLELWIQEDRNYDHVISSFKNPDVRSILFGTLTYFEGVDLKGDALSQVILTRLPYSAPHPIQEILERKSGYGQWEATVRFEQAFGRLIRTSSDSGTFSVLDNRVSYLKHFLHLFEREGIPTTERIEDVFQFYR